MKKKKMYEVVPQAFLNGFGHDACAARSTSDPPPPPSSTATSSRPSSCTDLAPDPLLLFPNSTLIPTLMPKKSNLSSQFFHPNGLTLMGIRNYGLKDNLSYSTTLVKPTPQSKVTTNRRKVTKVILTTLNLITMNNKILLFFNI